MRLCILASPFVLGTLALGSSAHAATRIKEVASVQGVRANQLVGYGLVVGLDGTGDQSQGAPFTAQSLAAMLSQMGVAVPPGVQLQLVVLRLQEAEVRRHTLGHRGTTVS